jgi:CBS domain.
MQHVKDLMIPLAEYPCISTSASLHDAIKALERAMLGPVTDPSRPRDRAVLVKDADGRVFGKLSLWDILRGIEPRYGQHIEPLVMIDDHFLWTHASFAGLADKARAIKVKELLREHTMDEFINEDAPLDLAAHQLVHGKLLSLLVKRGDRIVGILRLSDAFRAVARLIEEAEAQPAHA